MKHSFQLLEIFQIRSTETRAVGVSCKQKKCFYIVTHGPGAKLAGSSGVTHSGEQEGGNQPFRGWRGKGIPRLRT